MNLQNKPYPFSLVQLLGSAKILILNHQKLKTILMSGIAVVASISGLVEKARKEIREYNKHKTVKEQLGSFLQEDAENYIETFKNVSSLTPDSLYPLLDEIKDVPSKSQINDFVSIAIESQELFIKLLFSFVQIAKDCSIICKNESFMKNLLETDGMIHDFLKQMDGAYKENETVAIGENYYGFFKLYRNQLIKYKDEGKVEAKVKEAKDRLQFVKKTMIPNIDSSIVSRENKKRFQRNFDQLCKATKKMSVKGSIERNLQEYVLPELKPIVVLLDEIIEESERQAKAQKKLRLSHPYKK